MAVMHVGVEENRLEVAEEEMDYLQVSSTCALKILQTFSVLNYHCQPKNDIRNKKYFKSNFCCCWT